MQESFATVLFSNFSCRLILTGEFDGIVRWFGWIDRLSSCCDWCCDV